MPPTYRMVNYSLRPSKQIERRMIAETCQRLGELAALSSYRYIGFGSIYFRDFIVFHKTLGLTQMISIERDTANQERFEFNKPYACVDLRFGESKEVLPRLAWDIRTILWLDYEGPLHADQLGDVTVFCASAISPSLLVVTVHADSDWDDENPLSALRERIGADKMPLDIKPADFGGWGTAAVSKRILSNHVQEQVARRNGGRTPATRYAFDQLFFFEYKDGAKMMTFGGILYDEGLRPLVSKCGFSTLEFVRTVDEPYRIEVPSLTYRELRDLDSRLPGMNSDEISSHPVPNRDIERYAQVYRYFPTFAETEA